MSTSVQDAPAPAGGHQSAQAKIGSGSSTLASC